MTESVANPISIDEQARRDRARADRVTLMSWLLRLDAHFMTGRVLMTREPGEAQWEQTGFIIKSRQNQLNVKVGSQPYQPIGAIDNEFYYPSQASKLIWIRDFALVEPQPIKPPFDIKPMAQADLYEPENPNALSDKERDRLQASFEDLGKELVALSAAMAEGETTAIKDAEQRVLDTLKLAAIQNRMVDGRIRKFAIENPELASRDAKGNINGFDFDQQKIRPLDLGKLVSEFIRLKLNDDVARRFVKSNELVASDGVTYAQNVAEILNGLTELVPADGKAFNADVAAHALNNARAALPVIGPVLEPFVNGTDIVGALQAAIKALQDLQSNTPTTAIDTAPAPTESASAGPVTENPTEIPVKPDPAPTGEASPLP